MCVCVKGFSVLCWARRCLGAVWGCGLWPGKCAKSRLLNKYWGILLWRVPGHAQISMSTHNCPFVKRWPAEITVHSCNWFALRLFSAFSSSFQHLICHFVFIRLSRAANERNSLPTFYYLLYYLRIAIDSMWTPNVTGLLNVTKILLWS